MMTGGGMMVPERHLGPVPQSEIFIGSLTSENLSTVTIANTNNAKVRLHRAE